VIQLRYFQEMSYQEISNSINEPLSNVKVKLLRAKKLLAEIIEIEDSNSIMQFNFNIKSALLADLYNSFFCLKKNCKQYTKFLVICVLA
jgi:hypothetical protein